MMIIQENEKNIEPGILLLYGLPKCGKTTAVSKLPNSLIIDTDKHGTDYITHKAIAKIETLQDIRTMVQELSEMPMFDFGVLDTATGLEQIVSRFVVDDYNTKNKIKVKAIEEIPYGAGAAKGRDVFMNTVYMLRQKFKRLIVVAHVKYKDITGSGGTVEKSVLNLQGKTADILPAFSDAVGFVWRKDGKIMVEFSSEDSNKITVGSRIETLQGTMELNWEKIYPETLNKKE